MWTLAGVTGSAWKPSALVSIRVIAHAGDGPKRCITPPAQAWRSKYPMSAAVLKGDLVFVGGQLATIEPPFLHVNQFRQCYAGMLDCLREAGADFADVLDFTSFHEDIRGALPTMDDVYIPEIMAGWTPNCPPRWPTSWRSRPSTRTRAHSPNNPRVPRSWPPCPTFTDPEISVEPDVWRTRGRRMENSGAADVGHGGDERGTRGGGRRSVTRGIVRLDLDTRLGLARPGIGVPDRFGRVSSRLARS
ncbi:Rid family hydrolase [Actinocrispum sp. NPDC049592]|uniref:Rid family hydrolase n=1 Tax=Actinocrispum sp. NPDC049592 TaxID=3154835 RepID=UPI003420D53B